MSKFVNHYECNHDGRIAEGQETACWEDESDCMNNDKCPVCNAEIEPHYSEDLTEDEEPEPRVIKGTPREKWEEVQAIQHDPFIYIMGNGSKWAGDEEDDIEKLFDVLAKYRLDYERFGPEFHDIDPCQGIRNPNAAWGDKDAWIDGPRLYACDGVVRFFGNFLNLSHGFSIDTNHKPTIEKLMAAIEANKNLPE